MELWADDHRRLTLWINPGRTKRSLGLSESLGPVLEAGRRYTLEVAAGLPDARGRPLAVGLRHPFRTGAMDRDQPRIQDWRIAAPAAGGRDALVVRFAEPLDHALLGRLLQVEDAAGRTLEGSASVSPEGTRWSFVPASPWAPGRLQLAAGGELEDLAGNSLYRPFETSAGEGRVPLSEPPAFKRSFVVRSR